MLARLIYSIVAFPMFMAAMFFWTLIIIVEWIIDGNQ